MSDNTSTILTETGVGSDPTVRDLLSRVAALEDAMQTHTGDTQGASGQFYPHPVQIIDTAEFGGGFLRLDANGMQVNTSLSTIPAIYFTRGFQSSPANSFPQTVMSGDYQNFTLLLNQTNGGNQSALVGYTTTTEASMRISALGPSGYQSSVQVLSDSTGALTRVLAGPLVLQSNTVDWPGAATRGDGALWYNSTVSRFRCQMNGITGTLATEIQSSSAAAIATSGTITTAGVSCARVNPAGAVTGIILQSGTTGGQMCIVVNEAAAANTVTFAASGTSHVADGASSVIAGLNARLFIWDSGTSLWYPCK